MDYKKLRLTYKEFVYKSYSYNLVEGDLLLSFVYTIKPDISFEHKVIIKDAGKTAKKLDNKVLENLIFNIGLVEIPSYWKTTCSPVIKIEAGKLDGWQIEWWRKLFMNGMMQYFYTNKIDFRNKEFLNIETKKNIYRELNLANVSFDKVLIPVGGGKDSAVTLGLMDKSGIEHGTLVVEKASSAAHNVSKLSLGDCHTAERILDLDKLSELNKTGYLNGHVPYSAVLYYISILTSYIFDYSKILFSNENSSNEGNIQYLGTDVNHQYSKTLEFENDFSEYNEKYLSNIKLFSFLRPIYEIQISKLFSRMEKYFSVIRSCNVGQKESVWCGKCSKCLSTYILLMPFLGIKKTVAIFGSDLLKDESLKDVFLDLIEESRVKPFECVGTRLELKVALNMALKMYSEDSLPPLLRYFKTSILFNTSELNKEEKKLTSSFGENNLPSEFKKLLKSNL